MEDEIVDIESLYKFSCSCNFQLNTPFLLKDVDLWGYGFREKCDCKDLKVALFMFAIQCEWMSLVE